MPEHSVIGSVVISQVTNSSTFTQQLAGCNQKLIHITGRLDRWPFGIATPIDDTAKNRCRLGRYCRLSPLCVFRRGHRAGYIRLLASTDATSGEMGDIQMWRSIFLAIGVTLCVLAAECMVLDHAVLAAEPATASTDIYSFEPVAPTKKTIKPPEWAPWSLASVGSIVIFYAILGKSGG